MLIYRSWPGSSGLPGLHSPPEESESLRVPKMVIAFTDHSSILFCHLHVREATKKFGKKAPIRVNLSVAAGDPYSVLGQDRQRCCAR